MKPDIAHPRVLFVMFHNDGDKWSLTIPHAYGDGGDFVAELDENLSLQFQPVAMKSELGEEKAGVLCYPLTKVTEPTNLEH